MKKLLWSGVGLGIIVLLVAPIFAGSLNNTIELQPLANHDLAGPVQDRARGNTPEDLARWRGTDANTNALLFGFSSTAAANAAASYLQNQGYALSFTQFGRAPFQQLLTVTKDGTANPLTTTTPRSITALPEPTTLLLLGSGLAVIAAGLRKRKRK